MANLRALDKRRKAIRNIRKITRTMELIATARFKKALDRAIEAEAFTRKIAELAADLTRSGGDVDHPLLQVREPKRAVLLVIGSNRGLCGGYNASVFREANRARHEIGARGIELDLELSGKRAVSFFRFQRITPTQTYLHFEDKPTFEEVEVIADRYISAYIDREIDRVDVAYTKFVSASRQTAVVETLLPLGAVAAAAEPGQSGPNVDYEFIPGAADILGELVPAAFKTRLFKCFLDAAVNEQIARRVAMKAATENAGDLIKSLNRTYNRERQARITKEIAEVIGGAEALK